MVIITDFNRGFHILMKAIWIFSDKSYQEKFWIRGERPLVKIGDFISEVLDFQNTFLAFFQNYKSAKESLELEINRLELEKPPIRKLKSSQLELLKQFHKKLIEFDKNQNSQTFVFDVKWDDIINSAKFLYKELSRKPQAEEIYPNFLCNLWENSDGDRREKLCDFWGLIRSIWELSNKDYQERYWVAKQEPYPLSSLESTMDEFEEESEIVLGTSDYSIEMTDKEREMLTELLRLVEEYDFDQSNPSSRYGENDAAIMKDPNWQEIRNYAKLVYEEITIEKA